MRGGGKYEKETDDFRHACNALGVITIVMAGSLGHGFEVQLPTDPRVANLVPVVLREMADKIENDLRNNPPETWKTKEY